MSGSESIILFSLVYLLVALCFIASVPFFVDNSFSIEGIFFKWLGFEHSSFVKYHMKRTSVTILTHTSLPLIWCLGIYVFGDSGFGKIANTALLTSHPTWVYIVGLCTSFFVFGATLFAYWTSNNFFNHPMRRKIEEYQDFEEACQEIDQDFRSIDKFQEEASFNKKVVLLTNWLFDVSHYQLKVCHLDHINIKQSTSEELFTPDDSQGYKEFIRLNVYSARPEKFLFSILVTLQGLSPFRSHIRIPVGLEEDAVEQKTITQLFLDLFEEIVHSNREVPLGRHVTLENCIGCDQQVAQVRLVKGCEVAGCGQCRCTQPLWCLGCMGQWFASRQDQGHTEGWLDATAPCPMCRCNFCLKDVSVVTTT